MTDDVDLDAAARAGEPRIHHVIRTDRTRVSVTTKYQQFARVAPSKGESANSKRPIMFEVFRKSAAGEHRRGMIGARRGLELCVLSTSKINDLQRAIRNLCSSIV